MASKSTKYNCDWQFSFPGFWVRCRCLVCFLSLSSKTSCRQRLPLKINETNNALLLPFLLHDPWEPSRTMLLSDPCVRGGTSTARLPPASPLLPLPSVALQLTITLLNLWDGAVEDFVKRHNVLLSALMFFFLLNCERTGKYRSLRFFRPHQSHCAAAAAGQERCRPRCLTAKTCRASERQQPTPHRLC